MVFYIAVEQLLRCRHKDDQIEMMIAARKTQRYAPVILRRLVKKRLQCRQIVGGKDAADDGSGDGNFFPRFEHEAILRTQQRRLNRRNGLKLVLIPLDFRFLA